MRLVRNIYFLFAWFICLLIIYKSIDYLNPDFNHGFLIDKLSIFPYYKILLYAHMSAAPIAFLSGLYQFIFKKSFLHQWIGKIYIVSILFFAAPSGFGMSFYAIGGVISSLNFSLMAILWFYFTLKAYQLIRVGNIKEHGIFMSRSFIMTNSGILIRLLSFVNNQYKILEPTEGYITISLLSWIPILMIHELILRIKAYKTSILK